MKEKTNVSKAGLNGLTCCVPHGVNVCTVCPLSHGHVPVSLVCPAGRSGDPTVCEENSASVTLVGCLLEEKGIDYTMLHLNDPTCTGQRDELDHMVTFSFNSSNTCGTEVMVGSPPRLYSQQAAKSLPALC